MNSSIDLADSNRWLLVKFPETRNCEVVNLHKFSKLNLIKELKRERISRLELELEAKKQGIKLDYS